MVLFIILGLIFLIAFVLLGILFFMLSKESQKNDEKAIPLTDLDQLRKELSSGGSLLQPQKLKLRLEEPEFIPPYELKVSSPIQEPPIPLEEDIYKKRAQELEDELCNISQKADTQSSEAKQMIDTLTNENELLRNQKASLEEAQQKMVEIQAQASGLKTENTSLQTQLDSTNAKVHFLEEEMAAVKIQTGEEISRANATVAELNQEKELLLSAPKPDPDAALLREVESLKSENLQLKQRCQEIEQAQQKLQELNGQLIEKNDALQYEMIKARAQSSGLERVSFNYKNQLEDFFKKINAVQVTNEHLSQVKNRLEGMMEQIKSENEELVKKDQLSQFELEKNRSRLVNLEREYQELKLRMQQTDQQ